MGQGKLPPISPQFRMLTHLQQSNYSGFVELRVESLIGDSDGSRSQIDWILERTNRQPSSSSRFRVEQPMESTYHPPSTVPMNRADDNYSSRNGLSRLGLASGIVHTYCGKDHNYEASIY